MKNKERFFLGGSLLAITSVAIRFISLAFNVYVTGKLGEAGMGLITLVTTVYNFAVTFATSGIKLCSTRMCAEALGHDSPRELRGAMRRCMMYSLVFGTAAMVALMSLADIIGGNIIGDLRTVKCLRLLSPALPCISLGAALNGYFTAVRRVYKNAIVTFLEQGAKIFITVNALTLLLPKGLEYACIAVVCGSALSEAISFLISYILYKRDLHKNISNAGDIPIGLTKKLLSISLPVALTAYVRSGLLTLEHLLIPIGLKKSGLGAERALASYGVIHAMAFPTVLFPMAILSAFSGMIVPEISEAAAKNDMGHIKRVANKVLGTTLIFSLGSSFFLCAFADELGTVVYNSPEASYYIRLFGLLVPVMYLDSAVDSLLQGLGEQVYTMKVNIIDAGLSALLVWLILPKTGITGYVGIIFFCELINTSLSMIKLIKRVKPRINIISSIIAPGFCAIGGISIIKLISHLVPVFSADSIPMIIIKLVLFVIIFVLLLLGTFTVRLSELPFADRLKVTFKRTSHLSP